MKASGILIASSAFALGLTNVAAAQTAPEMMSLSTGSEIATWSIKPDKPVHKTPVIYLHGGPGMYTEARRFAEGAPLRAAGFTTIYFDQPGGGLSKRLKASEYSIERAVADLEALRVQLKQDHLILWGNSYGAGLATVYAARFPGKLKGLILTSPGSFPGTNATRDYSVTNRDKVKLSKELSAAVGKIDSKGAAAETDVSQEAAGKLFDVAVAAELIEAMVCKGAQIKPPALQGGGNLFANRIVSKSLDKLAFKPDMTQKVPTLILRGECDFITSTNADRYANLFGTKVTSIPRSGHGFLENREAVDAALYSFATGPLGHLD